MKKPKECIVVKFGPDKVMDLIEDFTDSQTELMHAQDAIPTEAYMRIAKLILEEMKAEQFDTRQQVLLMLQLAIGCYRIAETRDSCLSHLIN